MADSLVAMLVGRLRQERLRLGWTQDDAAARAGMSASAYKRFEVSARITVARLEQVLGAFGLTVALVPASGSTAPTPDARVARTRQRGLRHVRAAIVRSPQPLPDEPAATPVTTVAEVRQGPPKRPVDAGRVASVAKSQRDRIVRLIRTIVANRLTNYTAYQVVQNTMNAATDLEPGDRSAFVGAVESQLNGLNPENIAGYGIGESELDTWIEHWKPDLGIVDVVAPKDS